MIGIVGSLGGAAECLLLPSLAVALSQGQVPASGGAALPPVPSPQAEAQGHLPCALLRHGPRVARSSGVLS